jgi:hypothetical protein
MSAHSNIISETPKWILIKLVLRVRAPEIQLVSNSHLTKLA